MKNLILKNYIHLYEKNKITLIKYWVSDKKVLSLLRKYDIEIELFIKKYALGVINYYIDVVKEYQEIGACPSMNELILFLKEKNISSSELFTLCIGFKNSLLEYTYDLKITNLQIEKELNYIFDKNFAGVLEKYTESIKDVEKKLLKSSDIVDKYVIMSRTDLQGNIIRVSEAFCNISGYSKDELIGKSHDIIRHTDMKKEFFKELWNTISSNETWHGEIKNLSKDNKSYWLETTITPTLNENGEILFFDAISQDISSRKELEDQQTILIEQSKAAAMGEMISMIAHQWRQPLQAVSVLIQKLPITKAIEGSISEELLDQVVDGIGIQLNYMSKTIDDFRDFFLPDKAKENILVSEVINKSLEFVSFMLKASSIEVNIDIKKDITILVHVNELVQVLINLIKNAKDVIEEKNAIGLRNINIASYEDKDHIIIEIEDNGGGIPNNIINKIFEPYFSTKSDKNGTGLGLYMSKTIIDKHCNGLLSVDNTDLGAKFQIKLPIS